MRVRLFTHLDSNATPFDPGLSLTFTLALFLVFVAAAIAASIALYLRQPLLLVYIATGCVLGPHVLDFAGESQAIYEIGEVGIVFLLFLIGLDLPPSKFRNVFRRSIVTGLASSVIFFLAGFLIMTAFGFSLAESILSGIAVSFSSTVMAVKLLPIKVLHHRHIGELVISLLLLQDLIAIVALLVIEALRGSETQLPFVLSLVALPLLVIACLAGIRWIVVPLLKRFDTFTEYVFLLAIGWCLGVATIAHFVGLSFEIGGFVAGVSLANRRVAQHLASTLQPLRDFFLVLYFFSVGASFNPVLFLDVLLPILVLGSVLLVIKPMAFRFLLRLEGENRGTSRETGVRLGQCSEFSLFVVAAAGTMLTAESALVVTGVTILTILVSTYVVVARYPNPMAFKLHLRKD